MQQARNCVMPRWGALVEISQPYLELCSKHVLVMDYLPGKKLVDGIKDRYKAYCDRHGINFDLFQTQKIEDLKAGKLKMKSIDEEIRDAAWMKFWCSVQDNVLSLNPLRALYNYSGLSLIWGRLEYYKSEPLPELGRLIDVLCRVHAAELFEDGRFNGDPHPGNIL